MRNYIELGTFENKSANLRVSDPCYDRNVLCKGIVKDCLTGIWEADIGVSDEGDWGDRVGILMARHQSGPSISAADKIYTEEEDGKSFLYYPKDWHRVEAEIGVDSGSCGIFDDAAYQNDKLILEEPEHNYGTRWYSFCCDLTLSEQQGGVLPGGCVSSSGYGDGCYTALCHKNADGQVDAVCIVYI